MTKGTDSKVPKIRFKGFVGEWEEKELGELADIKLGKMLDKAKHTSGQLLPYLNNISLRWNSVDTSNLPQMHFKDDELERFGLQTGDVVVCEGGEPGRSAIWDGHLPNLKFQKAIHRVRFTAPYEAPFLVLHLQNIVGTNRFEMLFTGGGIKHLTRETFSLLKVPRPSLPEQQNIAHFLSELDRMVGLHQRKHDKLVTLKQAMLQKMFPQDGATTPEIRFNGFEGDWIESELDSEVEFFSGLTYSPNDVRDNVGTFVLRSSNVKNGQIVDADDVYVESSVVDCDHVEVGDIIVVVRNGSRALIGKHATITRQMDNTVIGAFMTGLRSQQSDFVNALLSTVAFTKQVEMNMGATINQITTGIFKRMSFFFPDPGEQQKIGTYFRKLDHLISKHATQLEKLKNIKSACLEKMFV